jgi:hypothetical protein
MDRHAERPTVAPWQVSRPVKGFQLVQKVPVVQTPSFILPGDAGEEQRWGLERFKRLERFEPVRS